MLSGSKEEDPKQKQKSKKTPPTVRSFSSSQVLLVDTRAPDKKGLISVHDYLGHNLGKTTKPIILYVFISVEGSQ